MPPPWQTAVDSVDIWLTQRRLSFDEREKVREPLFHYTDAKGMLGIVDTRELWFTNVLHLNDPREFDYGLSIARDYLEECEARSPFSQHICSMIREGLADSNFAQAFGFYVFSLSPDPDELGQWRAYGDSGRGFAVGFSAEWFHPKPKSMELVDPIFVAPVAYGRDATLQRHREAIDHVLQVGEAAIKKVSHDTHRKDFIVHLASLLSTELIFNSLISKDEAYGSEREVRLIKVAPAIPGQRKIKFRASGSKVVPYTIYAMVEEFPLCRIMAGPTADAVSVEGVRLLLRERGIAADCVQSKISFRG